MKLMLNITRETHKYAEIIEEAERFHDFSHLRNARWQKGISAVSPHYVPAWQLRSSFFLFLPSVKRLRLN